MEGCRQTPGWLARLVATEIAAFNFPPPAVAPETWLETRGRGVLLGEPGKDPMTNAQTIRFMAPGISSHWPGGYARYTDEAGGYVNPRTGASRFAPTTPGQELEPTPAEHATSGEMREWDWPPEAMEDEAMDVALEHFGGCPVVEMLADDLGVRLVLDLGDQPEPRVYVDLDRPEYVDRNGTTEMWAPSRHAIVGQSISDVTIDGPLLELKLSDGHVLRSVGDGAFEAWQLVAAGVGLWACVGSSSVATFSFQRAT